MTSDRQPMVSKNKKILVLVIDDDLKILDLIERILKDTEFDVLLASNGYDGIKIAKEHNPSIILLDILIPKLDGFMICRTLKRNVYTKNIPVIFLTGTKSKEHIIKAIKLGASDYIVKPFMPNDLLMKLRKIIESEESLCFEDRKGKEEIKVDLKILVVNDSPTMRKIFINIVKKAGYSDVKEAENGRDALAKLMTGDFNFLITGWDMPLMNGIELTKAVRSDKRLKNLPILMVTNMDKNKDILNAKKAGVNDYIVAAFDTSKLKDKITEILRRFSQR